MAYDSWFCNDPHQMTVLRGDVFMADVSLVVGSEQGGVRPVLVLQNDVGNLFSPTVIVAVLSSKPRKWQQTHVSLTAEECGLGEDSTVFLEQIKTIDKWRLGNKCTTLSPELMEQVDNALGVSVGLLEIPISFNPETLIIRRRDVFMADLSPVVGSEQAGVCPVLIIQNDVGNKYSPTVIVAVVSDRSRKWQPTHVSLRAEESGLDYDSIVFLEQIRSIDKARLGDKCTTLSLKHMENVDYALGVSVGLREAPTKRSKYVDHG